MFLVKFNIRPKKTSDSTKLEDSLESFGAALMRNRNIYGPYLLNRSGSEFSFVAKAPEKTAFSRGNFTEWASKDLAMIEQIIGMKLKPVFSGRPEGNIKAEYVAAKELYFFAHAFTESSPVVTGNTGRAIPFYYLPINTQMRDDLYSWLQTYIQYDNIWLGSGKMEMPIYRQLADVHSDFNKKGLELARQLTKVSRKKTYYYLQRYWGFTENEEKLRCPSCGTKWYIHSEVLKKRNGLNWFNFRCNKCALVSHMGVSHDDSKRAKIGTFSS